MAMRSLTVLLLAVLPLVGASGTAAQPPEIAVYFGRATGSKDVDVLRLAYRRSLAPEARWWWPTHFQLGASAWQVPTVSGTTGRLDLNATPVWRAESARAYFEAGFGAYLLSHTINNDTTHLPSALQFGSHVGAGLRLGARGRTAVGIAFQHLSNGGIQQPNGGIDFLFLTAAIHL